MKELGNQFWQMCTRPISKFLEEGVMGGLLLVLAAISAIIWANSPASGTYESFLHQAVSFGIGPLTYEATLHHFINDGLMAIFFFVVGLEIKRELLVGELCEPKKALLPAVAAIGPASGFDAPISPRCIIGPDDHRPASADFCGIGFQGGLGAEEGDLGILDVRVRTLIVAADLDRAAAVRP